MRVCILGDGLSALTLAKALINQNIFVDMFAKKKHTILIRPEHLVFQNII